MPAAKYIVDDRPDPVVINHTLDVKNFLTSHFPGDLNSPSVLYEVMEMKGTVVQYVAALILSLGSVTASGQQEWYPYEEGQYGMDTESAYSRYPYGRNDAEYDGGSGYDSWYYRGENYRGPFGDYMSDGQCSFVNGIGVGYCD